MLECPLTSAVLVPQHRFMGASVYSQADDLKLGVRDETIYMYIV